MKQTLTLTKPSTLAAPLPDQPLRARAFRSSVLSLVVPFVRREWLLAGFLRGVEGWSASSSRSGVASLDNQTPRRPSAAGPRHHGAQTRCTWALLHPAGLDAAGPVVAVRVCGIYWLHGRAQQREEAHLKPGSSARPTACSIARRRLAFALRLKAAAPRSPIGTGPLLSQNNAGRNLRGHADRLRWAAAWTLWACTGNRAVEGDECNEQQCA